MSTAPTAASLRRVADLLDSVADRLPFPPHVTVYSFALVEVYWYVHLYVEGDAEQKQAVRDIIRAVGGTWAKSGHDDKLDLRQHRDDIRLGITVARDAVCRRVVTATREVVREVPAQAAVEAHTVTETVEDVEWVCDPVLAEAVSA
jgi:hypothetical protein